MGGEEPDKYFSVPEAEALIPVLTRIMHGLMEAHAEAQRIRESLRQEHRRIMISGGGTLDQALWRERTARLEALTGEVRSGIDSIARLGGVPKDLGMGLVDFPFLLNGQEVNLCWKLGEKKIRFWHGLDEGFAGRKPIPDHML